MYAELSIAKRSVSQYKILICVFGNHRYYKYMHTYTAHTFTIPPITGISQKQIDVHIGLYQGYVKHVTLLREQIAELTAADPVKHAYAIECLRRRYGWEFNGMRMHEFYFPQLEGGPIAPQTGSTFMKAIIEQYASWDSFIAELKKVCMSRGPGWTVVSQDATTKNIQISWTTEHEQGTLADAHILFAGDMWEHAFMVDYVPAEKAKHIDALLTATNWSVVEQRMRT
jgi:Fe-Mn family superoxide dismutase